MFDVNISIIGNKILGELVVDSYFFEPSKYDYAFYLIKEGEKGKLQARWYESSMKAIFDINNISGTVFVRSFIKDKEDGSKRTFDSEKILVSN